MDKLAVQCQEIQIQHRDDIKKVNDERSKSYERKKRIIDLQEKIENK